MPLESETGPPPDATGPPSSTPVLIAVGLLVAMGMMSFAPLALICRPIGVVVGFIYPAYASYKALESKTPEAAAQWLTYFMVFSLFTVFEYVGDWLISWIPLYYIGKLAFVLWLQLPQFKGATTIYVQYIQPGLKKHEEQIDNALEEGRRKAEVNFNELRQKGMLWGSQLMNRGGASRATAAAAAPAQQRT